VQETEFSRLMRQTRQDAGMGTTELAYRAGVSLATVVRAESGHALPNRSTLAALLRALGASGNQEIIRAHARCRALQAKRRRERAPASTNK